MSVSKLSISRRSQIIEDTTEPSCLLEKLISKHARYAMHITQIFRRDWKLNPNTFWWSCAACIGERFSPKSLEGRPFNSWMQSWCLPRIT